MIYKVKDHRLVIRASNMPESDHIKTSEGIYTAEQLIEMFDEEHRNQVPVKMKLRILEEVERLIQKEVIDTHVVPEGYDPRYHFLNWGPDTELYAYAPYHVLYIYYLQMRIASIQNDTKLYNTYATLYDNAILTFQQAYNRTNRRKPVHTPYYDHRRGGY